MAELKQLFKTKDLKTTQLDNFAINKQKTIYLNYDGSVDELIMLFVNPESKSIVHYIDSHVAILYEPKTMEVIGIQVEAFQKSFITKYAALQKVWRLRDCCDDLTFNNFGDIAIAFERQKPAVAREVVKITEDLLHQQRRKLIPVLA